MLSSTKPQLAALGVLVVAFVIISYVISFPPAPARQTVTPPEVDKPLPLLTTVTTISPPSVEVFQPSDFGLIVQTWDEEEGVNRGELLYALGEDGAELVAKAGKGVNLFGASALGVVALEEEESGADKELWLYDYDGGGIVLPVTLYEGSYVEGLLSPDGTKLAYTLYCGFWCDREGEEFTRLEVIDLTANEMRIVERIDGQYYLPARWLDNDQVIFHPGVEAWEGPMLYQRILTLNIATERLETWNLDERTQSYAVSGDGSTVAGASFSYEWDTKTTSTVLSLYSFPGEESRVLRSSDQQKIDVVGWLDATHLLVSVLDITEADFDCAYEPCLSGKQTLQSVDVETSESQLLNWPIAEGALGFDLRTDDEGNEILYYRLANDFGAESLRRFDPQTQTDEELFVSMSYARILQ